MFLCQGVYEQNAAEKALHIAASLGYARICQLLVDAGIEAVSGPSTDKGPFELLAKALQQQQKHSLLQQQHDILEAAAAAASITPLAAGTSGTTKRAAVAALEAAASSTLKHSPQQRRETTYNSNLGLSRTHPIPQVPRPYISPSLGIRQPVFVWRQNRRMSVMHDFVVFFSKRLKGTKHGNIKQPRKLHVLICMQLAQRKKDVAP